MSIHLIQTKNQEKGIFRDFPFIYILIYLNLQFPLQMILKPSWRVPQQI